jgi:hypothetical protein
VSCSIEWHVNGTVSLIMAGWPGVHLEFDPVVAVITAASVAALVAC